MDTVPQFIRIAPYSDKDVNEFCDIIYDYSMRLSEVQVDYDRIYNKLHKCFEFIEHIDVPFAFEYTKVSYKQVFEQFSNELLSINRIIEEFPQTLEVQCLIALNSNNYEDKRKSINYFDNLISYFIILLANLECSMDKCITKGLEAYQQSKQIVCRCK